MLGAVIYPWTIDSIATELGGVPIESSGGATSYSLTASVGSFSLTGQDAGLKAAITLPSEVGAFALSGQDANLVQSFKVAADVGSFALAGQSAALLYAAGGSYSLAAGAGAFALAGQVAGLKPALTMPAEAGTFSLAGQAANLAQSFSLSADAGSFALSGQSATLTYVEGGVYTLPASAGSFSLSGQDATLSKTTAGEYSLAAEVGNFALSGQDATFAQTAAPTYSLSAEVGAFTLSGQALDLKAAVRLSSEVGAFVLSGQEAVLTALAAAEYTLVADPGEFVLSGQDVRIYLDGTSPATLLVARVKSVLGASELIHSILRLSSGALASTTRPRIFTGQARTFLCGRNRGRLPFFEIHVSGQSFDHESYSAGAITQTALLTLHLGGNDPGEAGLVAERALLAAIAAIRTGPDNLLALGDESLGDLEQGPWGHRRTITFTVTQTYDRTTYEVV
jgi:hypothetical protein